VQPDGFVRGYDGHALARHLQNKLEARDPVTRAEYTSLELKRLERLVGCGYGLYRVRESFWRAMLIDTTLEMLETLVPLIALNDDIEVTCLVSAPAEGGRDNVSVFFSSLTYLYCCQRTLFRRVVRMYTKLAGNKARAKSIMDLLTNMCHGLFAHHVVTLTFHGTECTPVLHALSVPKRLR
jgi:hypothetical protein